MNSRLHSVKLTANQMEKPTDWQMVSPTATLMGWRLETQKVKNRHLPHTHPPLYPKCLNG